MLKYCQVSESLFQICHKQMMKEQNTQMTLKDGPMLIGGIREHSIVRAFKRCGGRFQVIIRSRTACFIKISMMEFVAHRVRFSCPK
jgi:hypothetical protein